MVKKLIMLVFGAFCAVVSLFANTETVNGIEWRYKIANGSAEITGAADRTATVSGYIAMPSWLGGCSVVSIASSALSGNTGISGLSFPDSITSIWQSAFMSCSSLSKVSLPSRTKLIGNYAFSSTGLESVTIPASVSKIGIFAFKGLWRLQNVSFKGAPPSVEYVISGEGPQPGIQAGVGTSGGSEVVSTHTSSASAVKAKLFDGSPSTAVGYYLPEYEAQWKSVLDSDSKWEGLTMLKAKQVSVSDVATGVWNSNLKGSKAFAEEFDLPLLVVWSSVGCAYCEKLETAMKSLDFFSWMYERNLVMVMSGDDDVKDFARNSTGLFPYVRIYWPMKGVDVAFTGRGGHMWEEEGDLIHQFMSSVDHYLGDWVDAHSDGKNTSDFATVLFSGAARASISSQIIRKGSIIGDLPEIMTKEGFVADGWWTEANGGKQVSENTVIVQPCVFYAHWTPSDNVSSGGGIGGGDSPDNGGGNGGTDGAESGGESGGDAGGGPGGGETGGGVSGGGTGGTTGGGSTVADGDVITIRNEEDFYEKIQVAKTSGKTFILANDLNLTGKHRVSAHYDAYHYPISFYGKLKGGGHTIRLDSSCTWYALFGSVSHAVIENTNFELTPQAALVEYDIENTEMTNCRIATGILAGDDLVKSTFTDCVVDFAGKRNNSYPKTVNGCYGKVASDCKFVNCKASGSFPRSLNVSIGGFVRDAVRTSFFGCRFEGSIESNYGAGGIASKLSAGCLVKNCEVKATVAGPLVDNLNASGCDVGGIVGKLSASTVTVCRVSGSVSQLRHAEKNVGGIVGFAENKSLISICESRSNVTGVENVGGIVGYLRASEIDNVLSIGKVEGRWSVGGVVGQAVGYYNNDVIISSSFSTGDVVGETDDTSEEHRYIGGFAGRLEYSDVSWCGASGNVSSRLKSLGLGGFVGSIGDFTDIGTSYAVGSVVGKRMVGGFSGWVYASSEYGHETIRISNCYARGAATELTTSYSEGVSAFLANAGSGGDVVFVANCYATGKVKASAPDWNPYPDGSPFSIVTIGIDGLACHGGLSPILGDVMGTVIGITGAAKSSYWNVQTTGETQSGLMGEGKTTAEMGRQNTYVGWDFNTIWTMKSGYPVLRNSPHYVSVIAYLEKELKDSGSDGGSHLSNDPIIDELQPSDIKATYVAPKAKTLKGAVYGGSDIVGIIELKLGKVSKKGTSKISATVTGLDGKKKTAKAVTVAGIDGSSPVATSLAVKDWGTMNITIGGDEFAGSLGKYHVQSANVGGNWTKTGAKVYAAATSAALPGAIEPLLPTGANAEPVIAKGGKWAFAKAAGVKFAKTKGAVEKTLTIDETKGKTNRSAMKLTYTPKTGIFKGSFKVYAIEGAGAKAKLKKYSFKVSGFVVDGVGYGKATLAKPKVDWTVRVE